MNQEIGITYGSTGEEKVFSVFRQLDTHLDNLERKVGTVERTFNRFFGSIGRTASDTLAPVNNLGRAFGSMRGLAESANKHVGGLNSNLAGISRHRVPSDLLTPVASSARSAKVEVEGLQRDLSRLSGIRVAPPIPNGPGPGGRSSGRTGGRAASQSGFLGGMGAFGFMARFMAFHEALRGGRAVGESLLGVNRRELAEAAGGLSSVGFDRYEKTIAESMGKDFSYQMPSVSPSDYMKTMTQAASALDVNKIGMAQMGRITDSAIYAAKVAQMAPEKMAENMSKLSAGYLMTQGSGVYEALRGGGRANVRGYGNVNISEMQAMMAAQIAKTVEKSNIWGTGLMDFMQYAAPVMAQSGWTPSAMMAWAGSMTDAGFKGPKGGRAAKDLFLRGPDVLARLWMLNEGQFSYNDKGKRQLDDWELRRRRAIISQNMQTPEEFSKFITSGPLRGAMDYAHKMSLDPKFGLKLVEDLGLSRDFAPQFITAFKEGFLELFRDAFKEISKANPKSAMDQAKESVDDTYYGWKRFTDSILRIGTSVGQGRGVISRTLGTLGSGLNWVGEQFDRSNRISAGMEFLDKKFAPDINQYLDPNLRAPKSFEQSKKDLVNRLMREEYESRMKPFPKPGPGAGLLDREEWARRERGVFNDVLNIGKNDWWGKTWINPRNQLRGGQKFETLDGATANLPKNWTEYNMNIQGATDALGRFRDVVWEVIKGLAKTPNIEQITKGGIDPSLFPKHPFRWQDTPKLEGPAPEIDTEALQLSSLGGGSPGSSQSGGTGRTQANVYIDGRLVGQAVLEILADRDTVMRHKYSNRIV